MSSAKTTSLTMSGLRNLVT